MKELAASESHSDVCGVFLFGSKARGDADFSSDTDVLIVYQGSPSEAVKASVKINVEAALMASCTFAEYSRSRLEEMFSQGHLFAWHLYQEARPLRVRGVNFACPIKFDRPQPYAGAFKDAENFASLLESNIGRVERSAYAMVYEAGLAYVALRNIAMSLSAVVFPGPIFDRWAPFLVAEALDNPFPCTRAFYESLVSARHASQRGLEAPVFEQGCLLEGLKLSYLWATKCIGVTHERFTI